MDFKGFSWIILDKDLLTQDKIYFGVKYNGNRYIYLIYSGYGEPKEYFSKNAPNKLNDDDFIYGFMKHYLINKNIEKTRNEVFSELQKAFENPNHNITPNDNKTETEDNINQDNVIHYISGTNEKVTPNDDNINLDYIPLELKKHDNDILKMLDDNLNEYVGDKTNLAMLILSVVAVKCDLASYIININGDSLSGKTTLIKTLFNLIPDKMIKNHNNSTISGITRDYYNYKGYDNSLIYLGNITDERKKQIIKIEELLLPLYKEQKYFSVMGSKTATENTIDVEIESNSFLSLTKSIKPYKSSNTEINDILTYLTVTPTPKHDLIQQLQFNHQENNQDFLEQHKHYIDSLPKNSNPMDIKDKLFNDKELLTYIIDNTNDLNYHELEKYQMLYCSYCIYLNISPSIESFQKFQLLTPENIILTDKEENIIKYLKKQHTNKNITLSSKNRNKPFKYFSVSNLKTYHGNIKAIKDCDNLNETIKSLAAKGVLNTNSDGLFYINQ